MLETEFVSKTFENRIEIVLVGISLDISTNFKTTLRVQRLCHQQIEIVSNVM